MAVDIIANFEALFILLTGILPILAVTNLVKHQFWGTRIKERWLGSKKYFWVYVIIFGGLIGATVLQIVSRCIIHLLAIGGNTVWAEVGPTGDAVSKSYFAVYTWFGIGGSLIFGLAARFAHVGGDKSDSLYTVLSIPHLLAYGTSFAFYAVEFIFLALLSYGVHKSFPHSMPLWLDLPFPILLAGFLALCLYNRAVPSTASENVALRA